MLFKRRKKSPGPARHAEGPDASGALGYRIEFDMMLKGNVYDRPSGAVRQFGVTVKGSTKLVTSGDWVDRETYQALVDAKAIPPDDNPLPSEELAGGSTMETIERQD